MKWLHIFLIHFFFCRNIKNLLRLLCWKVCFMDVRPAFFFYIKTRSRTFLQQYHIQSTGDASSVHMCLYEQCIHKFQLCESTCYTYYSYVRVSAYVCWQNVELLLTHCGLRVCFSNIFDLILFNLISFYEHVTCLYFRLNAHWNHSVWYLSALLLFCNHKFCNDNHVSSAHKKRAKTKKKNKEKKNIRFRHLFRDFVVLTHYVFRVCDLFKGAICRIKRKNRKPISAKSCYAERKSMQS